MESMQPVNVTEQFQIEKPDVSIKEAAKAKWDAIAKPLDGLGKLEEFIE